MKCDALVSLRPEAVVSEDLEMSASGTVRSYKLEQVSAAIERLFYSRGSFSSIIQTILHRYRKMRKARWFFS